MTSKRILAGSYLAIAVVITATGCVGPMACGPDACGPLAINRCGGCGDCDGCGELYVDPWINHPPKCGDPCDQCGNYNGQSCGKCRSVFDGVKSLWGYRCGTDDCGGGCDGGCDSGCGGGACGSCGPLFDFKCRGGDCGGCCDGNRGYLELDHRTGCGCEASCGCDGGCGGGCDSCGGGMSYPTENVYSDDSVVTGSPTVAEVYRPRRQRKIFTAR